jgi:predicted nucleotidyltransferase
LEGELQRLINSFKGISFSCIYGSYAKDKLRKKSDIDLLVVGIFNEEKFIVELNKLEKKFGREINFSSYSEYEFNEEKNKKGSFLNVVLSDKIILLKGNNYNE